MTPLESLKAVAHMMPLERLNPLESRIPLSWGGQPVAELEHRSTGRTIERFKPLLRTTPLPAVSASSDSPDDPLRRIATASGQDHHQERPPCIAADSRFHFVPFFAVHLHRKDSLQQPPCPSCAEMIAAVIYTVLPANPAGRADLYNEALADSVGNGRNWSNNFVLFNCPEAEVG